MLTITEEVKKKERKTETDIDKDSHRRTDLENVFVLRACLAWCLLSLISSVKEAVPHHSACSVPWT